MPNPFNPARMRGLSRGLKVVRGEPQAAARAKALRVRAAPAAGPEVTVIDAPTGEERRVLRAPRYSPEATAEQSMRAEAIRRHAAKAPMEDPRGWAKWDENQQPVPPGVESRWLEAPDAFTDAWWKRAQKELTDEQFEALSRLGPEAP